MIRDDCTLLTNGVCSSMPLSIQKCRHSKPTLCCSWRSMASSFSRAYTLSRLLSVSCKVLFILIPSCMGQDHDETSTGTTVCWLMKSSFFSLLPSGATMNARPYFSNFSCTFVMAELLFDTTSTVSPFLTILAMTLRMVWVFPVPGGPCTTLT